MWLRSEKRSSRIAQPSKTSTINLRKIIKNTPALKNLKQTTTTVTSNRRSGVYTTTHSSSSSDGGDGSGNSSSSGSKHITFSGDQGKQSPSVKCNIKSRTASVKRLGGKKSLLSKRHCKKLESTSEQTSVKCGRLRRKSLRNISEMGKENCWQDEGQLDLFTVDSKRGRKLRAGPVECASTADGTDSVDSASAKDSNLSNVETFSNLVIVNEVCDSCKPSTTCNCSSSSIQTDGSQSSSSSSSSSEGINVPKNVGCVNYIECDSTTDNDRTNLPSTSMIITVSVDLWFNCIWNQCNLFFIS